MATMARRHRSFRIRPSTSWWEEEEEEEEEVEQRDWAGLLPELVCKVADDLLAVDATEYIRLRAACRPWRAATTAPSLRRGPRFFPRNWVMIPGGSEDDDGSEEPHRFRNVLTGAVLRIRLPMPRYEFTYHGSTEGLLLLCACPVDTLCLLNPLTMEFADLPTMGAAPGDVYFPTEDLTAAGVVFDDDDLQGQGVDGSGEERERDPTVVICVTQGRRSAMFHAKPGDILWKAVDASSVAGNGNGNNKLPAFKGGLAMHGRFYVPTRSGDVLTVVLRPKPHLAYLIKQDAGRRRLGTCSYLAPSLDAGAGGDNDGMLLLRCARGGRGFDAFGVNVAERSLTELEDIGNRTVFLPSWTFRSDKFPELSEDAGVVHDGCGNLACYLV